MYIKNQFDYCSLVPNLLSKVGIGLSNELFGCFFFLFFLFIDFFFQSINFSLIIQGLILKEQKLASRLYMCNVSSTNIDTVAFISAWRLFPPSDKNNFS